LRKRLSDPFKKHIAYSDSL